MGFDGRFSYAVGRIWALENRMIDQARFNRMIDAESREELARILAETEYGHGDDLGPERFEEIIDAELVRVYDLIAGMSPDPVLTGVFRAKHDFQNMKVCLKARLANRDRGMQVADDTGITRLGWLDPSDVWALADGLLHPEELGPESAMRPKPSKRPDLREALLSAGAEAFAAYEEHGADPQHIDLIIDRRSFDYFYSVARSRKAEHLIDLIGEMADLTNVLICARLRTIGKQTDFVERSLVPHGRYLSSEFLLEIYGESDEKFARALKDTPYERLVERGFSAWRNTGSLAALESVFRRHLAAEAARAGGVPIGYEPVIAYLMAREAEADTLRRVFVGKMNRMPANIIRERLSDAYA